MRQSAISAVVWVRRAFNSVTRRKEMGKKKTSQAPAGKNDPIVDGVVSLYASNGESIDKIDQLYADDVQYGAPDLTVQGRDAVKVCAAS